MILFSQSEFHFRRATKVFYSSESLSQNIVHILNVEQSIFSLNHADRHPHRIKHKLQLTLLAFIFLTCVKFIIHQSVIFLRSSQHTVVTGDVKVHWYLMRIQCFGFIYLIIQSLYLHLPFNIVPSYITYL